MTDKVLLANGCSHVAGSESSISFVQPLAEKMNMTPVNLAMPGGGNDRILRTTVNYCLTNPVDFVVIGWTTYERQEVIFNEEWHHFGLGRQVPNNINNKEQLQKLFDFMSLYCCNWNTLGLERTLVNQLALKSFLENKGIDYLFFNAWNKFYQGVQHPAFKELFNDKYYKPFNAIFEDYEELMPDHYSELHHGNEQVHNSIAEELYEQAIRSRK